MEFLISNANEVAKNSHKFVFGRSLPIFIDTLHLAIMAGGSPKHHLAIYPGSFDPVTLGHLDVLSRARRLFDEVIIAVGRNPDKPDFFPVEERVALLEPLIEEIMRREPDAARVTIATYTGLTVDFARSRNASGIIRGIRNVTDLASECQLAITNRQVAGIETVFVVTGEAFAFLSSSLIRQIAAFGGSMEKLKPFVPANVAQAIGEKMSDPNHSLARLALETQAD